MPWLEKSTSRSRVDPGSTAASASPSRSRVDDGSFTSRTRFSQPSRESTTVASSCTMYASGSYSSSSPAAKLRAALVAVLLADALELVADQLPALACGSGEQRLDLLQALPLLGALLADLLDLEPRELVEADLEDRVGLHLVELERLHEAAARRRRATRPCG